MIKRLLFSIILMMNFTCIQAVNDRCDEQQKMVEKLAEKVRRAHAAGKSNQLIVDEIMTECAAQLSEPGQLVTKKKKAKKIFLVAAIVVGLLVVGIGGYWIYNHYSAEKEKEKSQNTVVKPVVPPALPVQQQAAPAIVPQVPAVQPAPVVNPGGQLPQQQVANLINALTRGGPQGVQIPQEVINRVNNIDPNQFNQLVDVAQNTLLQMSPQQQNQLAQAFLNNVGDGGDQNRQNIPPVIPAALRQQMERDLPVVQGLLQQPHVQNLLQRPQGNNQNPELPVFGNNIHNVHPNTRNDLPVQPVNLVNLREQVQRELAQMQESIEQRQRNNDELFNAEFGDYDFDF